MNRGTPVKTKKDRLFISRFKMEETTPFPEQPAYDQFPGDGGTSPKQALRATDLFSRFTADIIRQDVIFTR